MNIVEVQDSLKNFSQDQLISEINQPSGMVPQFLVLTELGRRNRMKQDIEGRQAQNQPTVAQEVVSAAGVPQGGIMDMARSMAPKSSIEQNDGVQMMEEGGKPKNRMEALLAYLRSLGADDEEEIKEATGDRSLAEIINFGGDYRPVKKADGGAVKMQQGTVVYKGKTYFTDGTYVATRGASGRIVPVNDPDIVEAVTNKSPSVQSNVEGIKNISANVEDFSPNFDTTTDPELDMSALDSVLGIRPEMIPQFPTEEDSEDPTNQSTFDRKNIPPNMLSGMPTRTETLLQDLINQNQTLVPGVNIPRQQTSLDNQPQEVSPLLPTYNEQIDPNAFTGRQSLDGQIVSTVGPTADEIERAQKVLEMNPVTSPKKDLDLLESAFTAKSPIQYTETGDLPVKIDPNAFTGRQSLDGQVVSTVGPTAAELENAKKVLEMNPVTASDAELEVLGEGLKRNTARQNFLKRDPEQDSNLFPELNFSNDPTKGISDPGGGLEAYFGTTESNMKDPFNAQNVLAAASQSSNADEFNDVIRSLQRSKEELDGGIPSDELSIEPFNNQPPAPFLPSGSGDTPDELMVPFDNTPSKGKGGDDGGDGDDDDDDTGGGTKGGSALGSLESEIANMLRENEDQQEKDKYLSLAKAGLALMASDQPTFGGALGEAGMAGIEDFQASRKAYRDDKITLLDAQRKLEQARATAAAKDKSGVTATNIVSTLNNIRNQKSKIMTKLAEIAPAIDGGELTEAQKNQAEMLKREIANLTVMESTYAGMLGGIGSLGATGTFDATEE
jgi:hypothetical protein